MEKAQSLEQLLVLAREGDQTAKESIVEQFKPLLLKNIMRYFGKNQDFYDWLQEGQMVILQAINNYDKELGVPFAGYLQHQVFYYYINQRKKIREEVILDQPLPDGNSSLLELLAKQDLDIEQGYIRQENNALLYSAMKMLSFKQKQVILGYYFQKRSLKSMSADQGLCYQALVKLKSRALKKLREEMNI